MVLDVIQLILILACTASSIFYRMKGDIAASNQYLLWMVVLFLILTSPMMSTNPFRQDEIKKTLADPMPIKCRFLEFFYEEDEEAIMKYTHNGGNPPYLDHADELEARRKEYYDALQKAETAFDRANVAMAKAQEKFKAVQRSWRGNDSFLSIELSDLERDANEFAEAVENFKLEAENEQSKFREWGSEKRQ